MNQFVQKGELTSHPRGETQTGEKQESHFSDGIQKGEISTGEFRDVDGKVGLKSCGHLECPNQHCRKSQIDDFLKTRERMPNLIELKRMHTRKDKLLLGY